jgi:ribonucleoside-triphosphate reductase
MNKFEESSQYFKTPLQEFVFYDKYSRYRYDLGRRETWVETVERAVEYLKELSKNKLTKEDYDTIYNAILNMEVMPSMRLLAMGGEAARRTNLSIYNCSYLNLDSIEAIVEIMTLSMAGVGVGYSVQRKYTDRLPVVPDKILQEAENEVYVVEDTTEGWTKALRHHIKSLYEGRSVEFDLSKIRPSGTPLKTKGGQASGPEVLEECLNFITKVFIDSTGRRLEPIDVHDIACCIGFCSISGGVRRTALISLFDSNDEAMLHAKDGDEVPNYRWFANNSAVFEEEPSEEEFHKVVDALFDGGRGEPGFYFLGNARHMVPERRDGSKIDGLNPCGEVTLRNMETCNLSSVICRSGDTILDLSRKIIIATVIGTIQSMADDFWNVRGKWSSNQKEERLLGVDLNGQMDCEILVGDKYGHFHEFLKELAVDTNKKYAEMLGINQAAATTCCKPNGNSGQLVDASSGIHPRYAPYYIRNVRVSVHSPIYKVLFESGVPMSPENGQDWSNITTAVVSFPVKAPESSITRNDMSALDMCNFWKLNKLNYTEMNPSVTINYKEEEKDEVKQWIWDNRMIIGGMAFLPYSDARYDQMPYIEITEEEYEERIAKFPKIDWSRIEYYETQDMTEAAQNIACMSGQCSL